MLAEFLLDGLGLLLELVLDLFVLGQILDNLITFLHNGDKLLFQGFNFLLVLDAVLAFEDSLLLEVLILDVHFVELLIDLLHLLVEVFIL